MSDHDTLPRGEQPPDNTGHRASGETDETDGRLDRYVVVNTATEVKESEPIESSRAKDVLFDIRQRMDFDDAPPFSLKLRKVEDDDAA